MILVDRSRPAKTQYASKEWHILEIGDTIKIESDGLEWLSHEMTSQSKITIQIVIDEI